MNYCSNCGNKVDNEAFVCTNCGVLLKNNEVKKSDDSGNFVYGLLGFFFPLVGLILYLCWKDEKPCNAKIAGKGALISAIINAVLCVIAFILSFAFFSNVGSTINNGYDFDNNLRFD